MVRTLKVTDGYITIDAPAKPEILRLIIEAGRTHSYIDLKPAEVRRMVGVLTDMLEHMNDVPE